MTSHQKTSLLCVPAVADWSPVDLKTRPYRIWRTPFPPNQLHQTRCGQLECGATHVLHPLVGLMRTGSSSSHPTERTTVVRKPKACSKFAPRGEPDTNPLVSVPNVVDVPDSHDVWLARVRAVLQEERQFQNRDVRPGIEVVRAFTARIGRRIDLGEGVPREIRRQQWSAFNVPLLWAAATGD